MTSNVKVATSNNMDMRKGLLFMTLLSLQCGVQPILSKEFASQIENKSLIVIVCELFKFIFAAILLFLNLKDGQSLKHWNLKESIMASGFPAVTYAVQNVLMQISYDHLDALVFSLINQTKLIWTALFVYFLTGKRYSFIQCVGMFLLIISAIILSISNAGTPTASKESSLVFGIVPAIGASALSGFGAALTQRTLQSYNRNSFLLTMELCVYGSIFLLGGMVFSSPNTNNMSRNVFEGWSLWTLLPIVVNACGGLIVAAVIKYAGGVNKAFSIVFGILLTGVFELYFYRKTIVKEVYFAFFLVLISVYLYVAGENKVDLKKKTR